MALFTQPFFRYYGAPDNYLKVLRACLTGGLNRGIGDVEALEHQVGTFVNSAAALALPQARLGIYLALRQFITPEKPKVILSPYTIYDVVNMVICAGGTPIFADIEESTCNISFPSAVELIDGQTGAVLVTHLHGLACDIESFAAHCARYEIPLIEDCAQAFGGIVNGKRLGSFGAVGVFSFSMKKHVNSIYGGCLVAQENELTNECRKIIAEFPGNYARNLLRRACLSMVGGIANATPIFQTLTFPFLRRRVRRGDETALAAVAYEHNPVYRSEIPQQYLWRMTACQARLAAAQIPDVDRQTQVRVSYAREYHALLGDVTGIRLPPLREDGSHVYLSFPIQLPDRLTFQREMMASGCDVRLQSYINNASAPCFTKFERNCPVAEETASRVVLLPINTGAGMLEIRRIAAAIRALFR